MGTRTWLVGTVALVLAGSAALACAEDEKRPAMTPDSENPTLKMLEDDAKGANDDPDDAEDVDAAAGEPDEPSAESPADDE